MTANIIPATPVTPPRPDGFALPPVRTRDMLLGSGPRLARDAFGPLVLFYVVWRLFGLYPGIVAATAAALGAMWWERRSERAGLMAKIALAIVLLQATVGLVTGSERLYLAQPVIISGAYGLAFLVSVAIRRPLAGVFAEETYPFPDFVRTSDTYRSAFSRISLVWGGYLIGRSALRLATLSGSTVEAFIVVNLVTGVPLTAALLGWSIWYGVRSFRRSEEWGDAIRFLESGLELPADPSVVAYNPFQPGFADDPYPHYREMQHHDPVHETPFGVVMVFGYDNVHAVLRSRQVSVDLANRTGPDPLAGTPLAEAGRGGLRNSSMLNRDAPDHTRLRRLVSKVFTPNAVAALRPRIQELVDEALDRAAERGRIDLISDLAFPLPFSVISEMLGMPVDQRDDVREWSSWLVRTLEPIPDPAEIPHIIAAGESMTALLAHVIEEKRQHPTDDLLSALIAAEDHGDMLSNDELGDQVGLLYIAGHETTVNLIGNGVLALLRHPDQLTRLRDDPSLDQNAIEELLRFDPPVQSSRRIALADLDLGGRTIERGRFIGLSLAAANRDPSRFGDTADRLDVARPNAGDHVSFGGGIHHCLGAALARLEAQVAITTLIRRFPDLALAGEPEWNGRLTLRGMTRCDLTLR